MVQLAMETAWLLAEAADAEHLFQEPRVGPAHIPSFLAERMAVWCIALPSPAECFHTFTFPCKPGAVSPRHGNTCQLIADAIQSLIS